MDHDSSWEILNTAWDKSPKVEWLRSKVKLPCVDWFVVVHHETGLGLLNDLGAVCDLAATYKARVLVDAVSSFGAHRIDPRVDAICFNSNKCLESLPGVAVVMYRPELPVNSSKCLSPVMNLEAYIGEMEFTSNTNAILALNEALVICAEEDRPTRYRMLASYVRSLAGDPFPLVLERDHSNVITAFRCGRADFGEMYARAREAGFVIYGGKDPGQFRIGNMGYGLTIDTIKRLFKVLHECVCRHGGRPVPSGAC
jgi:2-aminoethylphosphonate-pyruvate transaminase